MPKTSNSPAEQGDTLAGTADTGTLAAASPDSFDKGAADAIAGQQGSQAAADGGDMFSEGVAAAAQVDNERPAFAVAQQPADPLSYFRSIDPSASELWNQAGTARSGVERFACYMVKVARARRFVIVATYQDGSWQAFAEAGDANGVDLRTALGMLYA